jgi:hypothetical protein
MTDYSSQYMEKDLSSPSQWEKNMCRKWMQRNSFVALEDLRWPLHEMNI